MKELIDQLRRGDNVRAATILIKEKLKTEEDEMEFHRALQGDYDLLRSLLKNEDPKVRKNIAGIIGKVQLSVMTEDLMRAYRSEKTLFVKPEYLKAMKNLDYTPYLRELDERRRELESLKDAGTSEKHVVAELKQLHEMLDKSQNHQSHSFRPAEGEEFQMLFTTLTGKEQYLAEALKRDAGVPDAAKTRGGVLVTTSDPESLMKVRCFKDAYFILPGGNDMSGDPAEAADRICELRVLDYLDRLHTGRGAYTFRADVWGIHDRKEKNGFLKTFSRELEKQSGHQLINDTSSYQVTFQLSCRRDRTALLLGVSGLKDGRFDYRTEALPDSIQPYMAALIMEMTRDDLKGCGQILDPFCGSGVMLIERNYAEYAHDSYGVDIYGDGIAMAERLIKKAGMHINLIHKDMRDFTHEYAFDAVITDAPGVSERYTGEDCRSTYMDFLDKCDEWLSPKGLVVFYTRSPEVFSECLRSNDVFRLRRRDAMNRGGSSALFVLERA